MRNATRSGITFLAISLGVLTLLGLALSSSGELAHELSDGAWLVAALAAAGYSVLASRPQQSSRMRWAWLLLALGMLLTAAGVIARNATDPTAAPTLANVCWWLVALVCLASVALSRPPGLGLLGLAVLDSAPVVLAAVALSRVVAGGDLGGSLGEEVGFFVTTGLFAILALVNLQLLILYRLGRGLVICIAFSLMAAGALVLAQQSFGGRSSFDWPALLWAPALLLFAWIAARRAMAPRDLPRDLAPEPEAGIRALPSAIAIVALLAMAAFVHRYEDFLIAFTAVAFVAFALRFFVVRREVARAQKALGESERRFRSMFETASIGIAVSSLDGRLIDVNGAYAEMLGYTASELRGRSLAEIVHPDDAEGELRLFQELFGEEIHSYTVACRLLRKDGRVIPVSGKASLVRDRLGRPQLGIGVMEDITERTRAEQERDRLLGTLAEQNEQLRALDTMKDEFLALVSHELRTPLTSILGYVELLLEEDAGNTDQKAFLGVIERNSRRLLHLVGDLLLVAQIEAGKLSLQEDHVELPLLVRECVEAARPKATEKGLGLVFEEEAVPVLVADRDRLAQVLDNLIANAIKFTPAGGTVTVALCREAGVVSIAVSDTGIGIPADEQAQLFERFFRTSVAVKNAIPGTGLGLAITKAIAEAHGGRITVESSEGAGTTFRVELPLTESVSVGRAA